MGRWGKIEPKLYSFPTLTFNTSDDLSVICAAFERDVINLVNKDRDNPAPTWDFSGALNRIDQDFVGYSAST